MNRLALLTLTTIAIIAATTAAKAQLINVNADPFDLSSYTGVAILPGSADDFWNSVTDGSSTLLVNAASGYTGVTYSDTFGSHNGFDTGGTDANPAGLMDGYFYSNVANSALQATATVTLDNLTAGDDFTLVVFGAGDRDGQGDSFTLSGAVAGSGNSGDPLTTSATDRDIYSVSNPGDAYVTYTGVIGSGQTLTINMTSVNSEDPTYYAFNGLQIEESAVPEPKSWAMLFLGLGSMVLLSRIRKFLA